jgi:hypothetical protein
MTEVLGCVCNRLLMLTAGLAARRVKLVPVRSTIILGWVYDGFLTPAGIYAKEFYRLLKKERQLRFVKKGDVKNETH